MYFNILPLSKILLLLSLIPVVLIVRILRKLGLKVPDWIEFIFIVFVISGQFFGSVLSLMSEVKYYDKILHLASGILTSVFALVVLDNTKLKNRSTQFDILFIITISMAVACGWEIFEYTSDYLLHDNTQRVLETGVNDTMQDMLCATTSSIVFSIIYWFKKK